MFNWNIQDQVGALLWGEFNEIEDHNIMPYSKVPGDNIVYTFESCSKKPSNEDAKTTAISNGQSSCLTVNELSGPRLEMDTWLELLPSNSEISTRKLPNLDGQSKLFGNVSEDRERDIFLACDWDNIGDFDDPNWTFRDESIFGHDMITNVDDLLCPAVNMTDNTSQSIPISDMPLSSYEDQGCSSSVNCSGGKRKAKDKTLDILGTSEQTFHGTPHNKQLTIKDEERSKDKASEIINGTWAPKNISQTQQFLGSKVQYGNFKYPLPMNKAEHDELETISTLIDDNLEASIYFRLQDAVRKLDTRIRLCVGDTLLRLARSSMERQSANGTAWDFLTEGANHGKRYTRMQVEETYTNPIDCTVAHLLFQRSSES